MNASSNEAHFIFGDESHFERSGPEMIIVSG